jgi:uncharacterized protein (DUF433 family)
MRYQDRIVVDPEILAGKPVVRGTRISVELVLKVLLHYAHELDQFIVITGRGVRVRKTP